MKLLFSDKIKHSKLLILCLLGVCLFRAPANAQVITENTQLDFGRFVLVDNAATRQIELLAGGGFNADPQFIFFEDPQMGNITVTGYTPGNTLTVTIGTTTLNPVGGGGVTFSTGAVFTNPAVVVADGVGSATFDVGATLSSDGFGGIYSDDDYDGIYSVTVTD